MKFREEVMEKIFTYITIILLMGAVAFEAWNVYSERVARSKAEQSNTSLQQELNGLAAQNQSLQEENKELAAFRKTWATYAAFVGEKEVLYLKSDLFSRTDLIPQAALDALADVRNAQAAEKEEESSGTKSGTKKKTEKKAEITFEAAEFSFDNPDGENIFLPLSMATGDIRSCLLYTMAYGQAKEDRMELLYEIRFDSGMNAAIRDENGEIEWECIAFNIGEGWQGMQDKETEQ